MYYRSPLASIIYSALGLTDGPTCTENVRYNANVVTEKIRYLVSWNSWRPRDIGLREKSMKWWEPSILTKVGHLIPKNRISMNTVCEKHQKISHFCERSEPLFLRFASNFKKLDFFSSDFQTLCSWKLASPKKVSYFFIDAFFLCIVI